MDSQDYPLKFEVMWSNITLVVAMDIDFCFGKLTNRYSVRPMDGWHSSAALGETT